ncbi:TonB-dependent receptor domain-containing protein [Echinimonas agarilytica]|uniref:TonB-dependent receptor n=1 Tax=Echinimonas agarilytica TaxID=1215918 RepID=A0AA41W8Z1_9GAMM|nr:TonB-dependent receptor [Echinimonas agarilytica]MCM2681522.1 TonB-dependent receptor [Echinimonas agarilytica]
MALSLAAPLAQAQDSEQTEEEPEVIQVTGVRSSLRDAAFMKKSADQIMDAISAEDIGQLPDNNIAEALQRVTGVQINRDETGQGSGFQVRGLSQNRVEINGQGMASGGDERSNNFNAVDSALFSKIEVIKSPTADMVEGASGATIRLHTFKPLDFKEQTVNVSAQTTKDELADDWGGKATFMGTKKFDWGDWGEFGFLFNSALEKSYRESHTFNSNWAPMIDNQIAQSSQLAGKTIFRPDNIQLEQKPYEDDRVSLDLALQWRLNDRVEFAASATHMELERSYTKQGLSYRTNNDRNYFMDRDLDGTDFDESLSMLSGWSRTANAGELYIGNPEEVAKGGAADYQQYTGELDRYLIQTAVVTPKGDLYNPPAQVQYGSNDEDLVQENYQLNTKIHWTDDLAMDFVYAYAKSEKNVESYTMNMGAGQIQSAVDSDYVPENEDDVVYNLSAANVFFDYAAPGDLPAVGILTGDGTFSDMSNALLNPDIYTISSFWGSETTHKNEMDSLALDFDYALDNDYLSKIEFGARFANNQINRSRYELRNANPNSTSITSDNWRAYDQDLSTGTMLGGTIGWSNPTINWMDQIFEEQYGTQNYMSRFLTPMGDTFPGSNSSTIPSWLGIDMNHNEMKQLIADMFPGRSDGATCTIYDKDVQKICTDRMIYPAGDDTVENNREYDYLLEIPGAEFVLDQKYPYLIEEETKAVYIKGNFEGEIFDYIVTGNAGVRYIETETKSLGMNTTRLVDEDTWRPIKDFDNRNAEYYTPATYKGSYHNVLPSFNLNVLLTDDMFVRFAYAKTMTRPNPVDMSPSFNIPNYGYTGSVGNPALKPERATNYDISWEWYPSDINQFSAAVYYKQLKDFLTSSYTNYISPEDRDKNGLFDDPVTIRQPINGDKGTVKGIELAATHNMDYLPGWLNGFGLQTNYTYTDSDQGSGFNELDGSELSIKDLSQNSANFILFYDKYGFNFRAAYNYRDESYSENSTAGPDPIIYEQYDLDGDTLYRRTGISLPVWNDTYETLDLSMSYRFEGTTFFIQGNNLLGEPKRRYVGDVDTTKHLLREYNETGAYYTIGIRSRFN